MIDLNVPGIHCQNCASHVRQAIAEVDAEANCDVDLSGKRVRVDSALPPSDFIEALEEVGYPSTLIGAVA